VHGAVAAIAAAVLALTATAAASTSPAFDALTLTLQAGRDGAVTVHEILTVRARPAAGEFVRVIPLRGRVAGAEWGVRIDDVHVLGEDHRPLAADMRRHDDALHVTVRVLQPTATTVRILYRLRGALRGLASGDRLLWSPLEAARDVRMAVEAVVTLPGGPAPASARAWTGQVALPGADYAIDPIDAGVQLRPLRPLGPGEALTLDVTWPPGTVDHAQAWRASLAEWWPLALPAITLLVAGLALHSRGRDPRHGRSIKPEYAPPRGLLPAEAGALVDQRADPREAIATLVDLAVRGRLEIRPIPGAADDFVVRRLTSLADDATLAPLERTILQSIFGEELSLPERSLGELRQDARYVFEPIRDAIEASMVRSGLFPNSPFWVRQGWMIAGLALLFVTGVLLVNAGRSDPADWALPLGVGLSGAALLAVAPFMPRRTLRGARVLVRVRGFQEFLERAERDRLQRLPADTLHRWLPWAIALGVSDRWIQRFSGLSVEMPEWFTSDRSFALATFAGDLDRFDRLAVAALSSLGHLAISAAADVGAGVVDAPGSD
jgi:hypothetical protein